MTDRSSGSWLLWLCLSRFGHSLIFSAYSGILPAVTLQWGMSASQAGSIQSAWHAGFLTSLFGVGFLADRYGARRTFLASSVVASAAALAFASLADGFLSALLLYGLAGLCSGGSYTPGLALIFQEAAPARRGRAMGLFLAAGSLGYAASLGVISLLPADAWRIGLAVAAAGAVFGTVCARLASREVPNQVYSAAPPRGQFASIAAVLRDGRAMACILAYTFHCWELLGMWAWLPAYLAAAAAASGATTTSGGIAAAALSHLVSVLGSVVGGTLSDRLGRPRVMLIMSCASLACSFAFGWMIALPLWLLTAMALFYNLAAIADSSVYSTALAEVVPPQRLGAAYSVRSVLGFGAGAVSPVLFGAILDFGRAAYGGASVLPWGLAWASLGFGALLGPWMILRLQRAGPYAASRSE